MSLNESIIEDAALEWFEESGHASGHRSQLVPGKPAAEWDSSGEVVLVGRLRQALHRLSLFTIHSRRLATPHGPLLPKLLNHELRVAVALETFYA